LGRREASVEGTRERVLDAAREVLSTAGFERASLDDISTRAGVARATVYYQFKSKFGLFEATIHHVIDASPSVDRLRNAREHEDSLTGLRAYLEEICRFWASDFVFFRNVIALAAVDPDAEKATDQFDFQRRELLVWLVKRLHDQGKLRTGVSQKQALDTIWLLTNFRSFDHLYARCALSVKRSVQVLSCLIDSVLADEARKR
jgi:AcrR family transcriptional regulator